MKLNEKIKSIREEKKLSQGFLAFELCLDQSQYSRRENGQIQFVPEEILKLSKLLNTTISNLFGEETIVLTNVDQKVDNFEYYVSTNEKLIQQYELRIKEKEEMIAFLKAQLKS